MISKLFDHLPTPTDIEAKAFCGELNGVGNDSESFLNGYIYALYDQELIDTEQMFALIVANGRGTFSRNIEMPAIYCPVCGSCLTDEE